MAGSQQKTATVILLQETVKEGGGWGATPAKPSRYGLQFTDGQCADSYDVTINWNSFAPKSLVGQSVNVTISAGDYTVESVSVSDDVKDNAFLY